MNDRLPAVVAYPLIALISAIMWILAGYVAMHAVANECENHNIVVIESDVYHCTLMERGG